MSLTIKIFKIYSDTNDVQEKYLECNCKILLGNSKSKLLNKLGDISLTSNFENYVEFSEDDDLLPEYKPYEKLIHILEDGKELKEDDRLEIVCYELGKSKSK